MAPLQKRSAMDQIQAGGALQTTSVTIHGYQQPLPTKPLRPEEQHHDDVRYPDGR